MKTLLYVGNFHPWNEQNDCDLEDALDTFDNVIICVQKLNKKKPLKGQPTKLLGPNKERIKIKYIDKLSIFLSKNKEYDYIKFAR